jgi:hypothetical protein
MTRSWPVHLLIVFFGLCISTATLSATDADDSGYLAAENAAAPGGLQDLIRASRAKYLEGSGQIRVGDSDKARESFNKAVICFCNRIGTSPTPNLNHISELSFKIQEESVSVRASLEKRNCRVDESKLTIPQVDPSIQHALAADLHVPKMNPTP